jgi:predicted deacylase
MRDRWGLWLAGAVWGAGLLTACALMGLVLTRRAEARLEAATLVAAQPIPITPQATATARPTDTSSPTASFTPSFTSTPTSSPSPSRTATPTASPSNTRTPSPTATSSLTPQPAARGAFSSSSLVAAHERVSVIGYSVEGRPLEVYRFGDGPVKRMIIAGIHGGYEWNTVALADELIAHLAAHPDLIPPGVTLYILRVLNPDGYARAHGVDGRVNANGVDLNRNWPSHWQADWPRAGCWRYRPTTGGTGPASEPETRALMDFLRTSGVDALVNYHSAALGIFPGGQPPDPASLSLADAVAAVSRYPYPPIDTGCRFTGQLIDWASDHGLAALDVELTNHRDTDFAQNLRILEVLLDWRR